LRGYEWNVRLFVRTALGDDPVNPAVLGCGDVAEFIASMSPRLSPASMRTMGSALRSFFRYLRAAGLCDQPLEPAIPVIACWRLSALPRFLSDDRLEQVLATLETRRPYGQQVIPSSSCSATHSGRPGARRPR
jgi:integrase/recombinase XerD